jgi:hypothetical protein
MGNPSTRQILFGSEVAQKEYAQLAAEEYFGKVRK